MKLSLQEQAFVEKTCNIYKDARLADELTRIRFEMGIAKKQGRGKCQTIRDKKEE